MVQDLIELILAKFYAGFTDSTKINPLKLIILIQAQITLQFFAANTNMTE